jgi:hypothetical protein
MTSIEFLDKEQLFRDFYQVMGERGAISEILMEAGLNMEDALRGTSDAGEAKTYVYWNIPPLEVGKVAQKKIIKSRGGIMAILEFMAFNADWEQYKEFYNEEDELIV